MEGSPSAKYTLHDMTQRDMAGVTPRTVKEQICSQCLLSYSGLAMSDSLKRCKLPSHVAI